MPSGIGLGMGVMMALVIFMMGLEVMVGCWKGKWTAM
ncbi:MAG: hypothetical protein ACJAXZ_001370 [Akkermansiaceae bacterium]|jgi:hypothetical protein